jgi:predicted PurR-regulated permease PerM
VSVAPLPVPPSPAHEPLSPVRRAVSPGHRRPRDLGWKSGDILRGIALITGYLLALALVWVAREIVLTAFLGIMFGLAVGAAADRLVRYRIPRGVSAPLVVFGFLGLLFGIGAAIAPTLSEQGALLRERMPEAIDRIESWLKARPGVAGLVLGRGRVAGASPGRGDTITTRATASPADTSNIVVGSAEPGRTSSVPTLRQRVTEQLSGAARYLFPFLSSTLTVVVGLFLIIALAIFVGADPKLYHTGLMHLFPHGTRERTGEVLTRTATVLRRWLVTQLFAMVVIGVVTTVTLMALDVKAAIALGVIAGLLEFVPTIGPILSAVPAVAMGFLDSPEKALYVAIAYLVIQQLENNILIPLLMKGGMDLPPALTIVSQAVMALLFGFLGLVVAVPVLAAAMVPIKMLYVEGVIGEPAADELDTAPAP